MLYLASEGVRAKYSLRGDNDYTATAGLPSPKNAAFRLHSQPAFWVAAIGGLLSGLFLSGLFLGYRREARRTGRASDPRAAQAATAVSP